MSMSPADYAILSLADVSSGLDDVAQDAAVTFGALNPKHLNWRPDPTSWSVAQCLEHLIVSNERTRENADRALDASQPRTIWQRLPLVPALIGPMLVKSQAPGAGRKIKTTEWAQPAADNMGPDIVSRFAAQQRELAAWVRGLDHDRARAAIMESPFGHVIAYSVLNACRLLLAHDHRHMGQARRVMQASGFGAPH